ncbi:hypothetical protein SELMODRAFT_271112 [Selaginella moellendorffii]|uniref:NAD(P)-binding domain-containing protein n=1 Tax=Selaginella moellendorffii TaxID=88036 RepID=D8RUZ3_SELML|nr:uncharacterized protein At5g02240 [Selaginella moellendorffii]EFJ23867.1 hypothetical protein SELMODRAFT_271112 [Selaginella moellendorffii]|eukprot:XP_002975082.1 uncharacterized protein At5g02240 [Selaginella moellendorffii]
MKVLVVGSSSGCGLEVAKLLAASEEFEVYALVRNLERATKALDSTSDKVKFVLGDVTKPETLAPACEGMDGVVCTIGARAGWKLPGSVMEDTPKFVDYLGVKHLAEAAASAKVPKFVLVSSMGVTRPYSPISLILNAVKGRVLVWKLKGEAAVKEAYSQHEELGYFIIRPGGLLNKEGGQYKIIAEQGDKGLGTIARKDVAVIAQACLQGLCPLSNVTFEIINGKSKPPTDLKEVLADLKPDK